VKIVALWRIAPCSLYKQTYISEVHTASIIRAIDLMMEAVCTCETFIWFYKTSRCRRLPSSYPSWEHELSLLSMYSYNSWNSARIFINKLNCYQFIIYATLLLHAQAFKTLRIIGFPRTYFFYSHYLRASSLYSRHRLSEH
jgi:hypothetical protein